MEREPHKLYLEGQWRQSKECLETTETGSKLYMQYQARQVNVVLASSTPPAIIRILLDGQPLSTACMGSDIQVRGADTVVSATEPRMFELISHSDFEQHELTLEFETPEIKIYAFTFVGCPASA
jgi:hypothetical protein